LALVELIDEDSEQIPKEIPELKHFAIDGLNEQDIMIAGYPENVFHDQN